MQLLTETLSNTSSLAGQDQLPASLDVLRTGLHRARSAAASPEQWRDAVDRHVRPHPILPVSHENPFVHRCFSKPRGYAGDAVMLDFIYRHPANLPLTEQATPRGRELLSATLTTPAPRAVRNRCRLLADEIDSVCTRNPRAEILSLACGHLREAESSSALAEGRFGRFLALDQDEESVALVHRDHGPLGVTAQHGSVKSVLARGPREYGQFDFIYAAGLYDYLSDRVATRLLSTLYSMLKPQGKLWVANFMPGIADVGFMEAIMDWWLIYRDAPAMSALAAAALENCHDVAHVRTFHETERNVVFLEAGKA
jgi:extracellular factor (EF) 3-hydroxypalmitic acid methyl ester biosynthesis protein